MAAQVLLVQLVIGVFVIALASALSYRQADEQARALTRAEVLDIATAIAASADIRDGLLAADPASALAPAAEQLRARTATDFVVVMAPDGTRYSHPDPSRIGQRYIGTIAPAVAGGTVVEDYTGTLGPSTRAVVPVISDDRVIGLVAVGIKRTRTEAALRKLLPGVALGVLGVGVLSGLGALYIAARIRRQTLGLGESELRRMHDHHTAVLHAVREGLVIVDADNRVELLNDEAIRLLGLDADVVGCQLTDLELAESLRQTLGSGARRTDEQHASGGRILVVSTDAVRRRGRRVATLSTLRDRTELEELTGQLSLAKGLADALHAQAHESANRLHTVVSLIELGRDSEAIDFATDHLRSTQRLTDAVVSAVDEPAVAALLLGKVAQAAERGVELTIDPDAHLPAGVLPAADLNTILGNLIDNAVDACAATDSAPEVAVDVAAHGTVVEVTVADTGPGLDPAAAEAAFTRGWSTKETTAPGGRGLGLALVRQTVHRLGGTITVSEPPGAVFTVRIPVKADDAGDRKELR